MIRQSIVDQMKQAMRDRQADKLSVLRFLLSEIRNVEIDAKHELSDDEIITLLRKETKKRKEAIEQYKAGGRTDIAAKESTELELIQTFLPAQMSREVIEQIVSDTIAANPDSDFGQIMRACMTATKGQADGKLVSELVRTKIS